MAISWQSARGGRTKCKIRFKNKGFNCKKKMSEKVPLGVCVCVVVRRLLLAKVFVFFYPSTFLKPYPLLKQSFLDIILIIS